jgi:hypothetical protein
MRSRAHYSLPATPEELALLAPEEAERWRRRLAHTTRPCGCKSGAAATLAALAAVIVWASTGGVPSGILAAATSALAALGVVLGAAVAGKLCGIAVGSLRHRRLRSRFTRRVRTLADEAVPA